MTSIEGYDFNFQLPPIAEAVETADPSAVYDPLNYDTVTWNVAAALMRRSLLPLPLDAFEGAGVYALYYVGPFPAYHPVVSPDGRRPIYVGKAVLPGGRKGVAKGSDRPKSLHGRIQEHCESISQTDGSDALKTEHFLCRYMPVEPLWIVPVERHLITHYQPIWNVALDGFGNHDPGKGRYNQLVSWWDAMHPGRPWAKRLRQGRGRSDAIKKVAAVYEKQEKVLGPGGKKAETELHRMAEHAAEVAEAETIDELADLDGEPDESGPA